MPVKVPLPNAHPLLRKIPGRRFARRMSACADQIRSILGRDDDDMRARPCQWTRSRLTGELTDGAGLGGLVDDAWVVCHAARLRGRSGGGCTQPVRPSADDAGRARSPVRCAGDARGGAAALVAAEPYRATSGWWRRHRSSAFAPPCVGDHSASASASAPAPAPAPAPASPFAEGRGRLHSNDSGSSSCGAQAEQQQHHQPRAEANGIGAGGRPTHRPHDVLQRGVVEVGHGEARARGRDVAHAVHGGQVVPVRRELQHLPCAPAGVDSQRARARERAGHCAGRARQRASLAAYRG
eukprot:scaffold3356_cov211-Prasinococcus_capsulatus_cf.AAC.2